MPTRRKPSYLLHRPTGQARVRISGRDHYLGEHGSPESRERYEDLIADWFARNDTSGYTLTIDSLAILYLEHVDSYYRKNGKPTSEATSIRIALRPLIKLYGPMRAREFSPLKLKAVRNTMIEAGWVRTSINRHVQRITACWKWAAENELVPVAVWTGLRSIAGLRRGRSKAKESVPVKLVPEVFVDAVQPHVTRPIWGAIQVQ